jgi:hypothetical protein
MLLPMKAQLCSAQFSVAEGRRNEALSDAEESV